MAQLPVYSLNITATLSSAAVSNARITVRNERSNEILSSDTDTNGQTIINAANFPAGVVTGDILTIFTLYTNYEGSVQHTVTTGGEDISLTLTAIPSSAELRYFTVQDFYDEVTYVSTDSDIITSTSVVKVGIDIEKEIDEKTGQRFDDANAVTDELHNSKNKYINSFSLNHTPIQSITKFLINEASDGSIRQWRNLAYTLLDSFTATTGWTGASGGSDTVTLSVNYTYDNRNEGTSCMYVAKAGTNNASLTVSNSSITSTDFRDKTVNLDLYTDSIDDLTATDCVELRFGSDDSNYFYKKWSKATFGSTSYTTLGMSYQDSDCEVTGSPDITACDYFSVVITLAAVTTELTAGDIRLDHLRIGDNYLLEYDDITGRVTITDSSNYPEKGNQQIKASYTYGYTSVPGDIRRMAVLMVMRHFMHTGVGRSLMAGREITPNLSFMDNEIKRMISRRTLMDIRNT